MMKRRQEKKVSDEKQYEDALRAMENGDEKAKTKVAFFKLSRRGGARFDSEGAVTLLKERAEREDDEAQWMLGICFEYGIGTEQDIDRAMLLYIKSSNADNAIGEFLMNSGHFGRGGDVVKPLGLRKQIIISSIQ